MRSVLRRYWAVWPGGERPRRPPAARVVCLQL